MFNKPYEWKWVYKGKNWSAEFTTENYVYNIDFRQNSPEEYEFLFGVIENDYLDVMKDTNENLSVRILSTIGEVLNDFVNEKHPERILVSGRGKRGKIYEKFFQRVMPSNYYLEVEDKRDVIFLTIKRK